MAVSGYPWAMGLKLSRNFILGLFVLLGLNSPALATWSIVVLNHVTGEVCVATATCIPNINIRKYVNPDHRIYTC